MTFLIHGICKISIITVFVFLAFLFTAIQAQANTCDGVVTCRCAIGSSTATASDGQIDFSNIDGGEWANHCANFCNTQQGASTGDSWKLLCDNSPLGSGSVKPIQEADESEARVYQPPVLSIPLPGLNAFTPVTATGGQVTINYIGQYVVALFNLLMVFASIITVVGIMAAGLIYMMARGDSSKISQAKNLISKSVFSILLLLFSYTILNFVDSRLTTTSGITIQIIDRLEYVASSGDAPASGGAGFDRNNLPPDVICSPNASLLEMANSFVGNVCYRFGAKGDSPPWNLEDRTDPSGKPYGEFCPENKICSDCSGFVDILRECAGLPGVGERGGTSGIFSTNSEKVTTCTGSNVNDVDLKPGDLLGFPTIRGEDRGGGQVGHVWMYVGEGKVVDASGGGSGRECQSVIVRDTSFPCGWINEDSGLFVVRR